VISGALGTNVWIVPNNPVVPANPTDPTKPQTAINPVYFKNYADIYMVSKYFDIEAYTQGDAASPYKVKYDYRNVEMKMDPAWPKEADDI
jgi:hypothetical protein